MVHDKKTGCFHEPPPSKCAMLGGSLAPTPQRPAGPGGGRWPQGDPRRRHGAAGGPEAGAHPWHGALVTADAPVVGGGHFFRKTGEEMGWFYGRTI